MSDQNNHISLLHWTKAKDNFLHTLLNLKLQMSLFVSNAPSPFALSHPGPHCQIQPLPCFVGPARSEFVSSENLENHLYSIPSIIVFLSHRFRHSTTQRGNFSFLSASFQYLFTSSFYLLANYCWEAYLSVERRQIFQFLFISLQL